jgi:uncharacterized protein (TIGR03085 family)
MESMSRTERAALCNTALEAGEQAPTLCGRWTVKDLVIHLLVRERDPLGAAGILVPQLEGLTDRSARRLASQDFTSLVERVRSGPPRWSPTALPVLDRAVNTLEFFVHHEDIRRAQQGWRRRNLPDEFVDTLWRTLKAQGAALVRSAGVPVVVRRTDTGETTTLMPGRDPVELRGPVTEAIFYLFGRDEVRAVSFAGPEEKVVKLRRADLGTF